MVGELAHMLKTITYFIRIHRDAQVIIIADSNKQAKLKTEYILMM